MARERRPRRDVPLQRIAPDHANNGPRSSTGSTTGSGDIETQSPTLDELRSLRADLYGNGTPIPHGVVRSTSSRTMLAPRSRAGSRSVVSASRHRRKKVSTVRGHSETKPRRRRRSTSKPKSEDDDDASVQYVYRSSRPKSHPKLTETPVLEDSESEEKVLPVIAEEGSVTKAKRVKHKYVRSGSLRSPAHSTRKRSVDNVQHIGDAKISHKTVHRSSATSPKKTFAVKPLNLLRRSFSARDEGHDSKPTLKRSSTTTANHLSTKPAHEPLSASTNTVNQRQGFLSRFSLVAKSPEPVKPPRLVECMTCLSDDIPHSKSAKLKCGHRMCHSCLKRIFKLSVKDPQHMPPKCCTADHIPLKHVEKLFDIPFKKLWNKRFQEYTTKNRIYCPARRCGEWIKPGNIHTEGGKKCGKCSRCKTKVCCLCNGKWHGSKDCPKDEETNQLLEAAKAAGWQRCYSCRTMVELKEGCNHMTCRCTAEFCMICGLKWKSCNCPWFNYETVAADRLNHMQVPGAFPQMRPARRRIPGPRGYNEEMDARRRQELLDEEIVRRLNAIELDTADDYQGGIGVIYGIGTGGDHHMNENYQRPIGNARAPAAAYYANTINEPPPAPALRLRDLRAEEYNATLVTRVEERVVPRRTRRDYAAEAARHAPLSTLQRSRSERPALVPAEGPRPSALAGLGGVGRGSARVQEWRSHVQPGLAAPEGIISS